MQIAISLTAASVLGVLTIVSNGPNEKNQNGRTMPEAYMGYKLLCLDRFYAERLDLKGFLEFIIVPDL